MNWFLMERDDSARDVLLPDELVIQKTQSSGLSCARTREVFAEVYGKAGPVFRLIAHDGLNLVADEEDCPDFLIWSWLPIFSARATKALSFILELDEFMPCTVLGARQKDFFIHLPSSSADGLLVGQSKFLNLVPMTPPIPVGAVALTVRSDVVWSGELLRVSVPGTGQILGELFATELFAHEWRANALVGALFKEISINRA